VWSLNIAKSEPNGVAEQLAFELSEQKPTAVTVDDQVSQRHVFCYVHSEPDSEFHSIAVTQLYFDTECVRVEHSVAIFVSESVKNAELKYERLAVTKPNAYAER
jgi:hypothetical protein